jgi:hypothetical protein
MKGAPILGHSAEAAGQRGMRLQRTSSGPLMTQERAGGRRRL